MKIQSLDLRDIVQELERLDHSKPKQFSITGGEPSSVPYLPKLMRYIKMKNKDHSIAMETNGFFLSNESYTKKLVSLWLDSLLFSFHSHDPEIFERITGIRWSFPIVKNTLSILKDLPVDVEISFVLNQYNFQWLYDTILFLNEYSSYKRILIANMFESVNFGKEERYHLRMKDSKDILWKSMELLKKSGKEACTCGIPLCYLKWFEDTYYLGQYDRGRYFKKSNRCVSCAFNDCCEGVVWEYGDLYGTDELVPILKPLEETLLKLRKNKEQYLTSENTYIDQHC